MSSNIVEIPMTQRKIIRRVSFFSGQGLVQHHQQISIEVKANNPLDKDSMFLKK